MRWLIHKKKNEAATSEKDSNNQRGDGLNRVWTLSKGYILWGFLFFVAVGTIAACGGGGGSKSTGAGSPGEVTPEQAKAGAVSSVGGTSKSTLGAVGRSAGNSSAIDTILEALGIPPNPDPDPTSNLEEQLGQAIALILENGERTGNTITFDPDETALCNDPLLVQVQQGVGNQNCVAFYSHITVVLTPGDTPEEGTLDIKYDNLILATIVFSPGSVSIQFDLAQLKSIVSAMVAQGIFIDPDLPETIEGVVKTSFTELGPDHARVTFSIEQAIKIEDAENNINIAAAPKVFEFTADGPGGTITAELGLGALAALFPVEDASQNAHPTNLNLTAATLHAELDSEKLVISNLGIGGVPFTLDATESVGVVDFSFVFNTFGVTVDETGITFDQEYNSTFELNDVFGLFSPGLAGDANVVVPQGSKWSAVGTVFDDFFQQNVPLMKVESSSGSATVSGTGFGSEDITAGDCFILRPSFGFPLMSANCPL